MRSATVDFEGPDKPGHPQHAGTMPESSWSRCLVDLQLLPDDAARAEDAPFHCTRHYRGL